MTERSTQAVRVRLFALLCAITASGVLLIVALALNADTLADRLDYGRPAQAALLLLAGVVLVPAMVPASVVLVASGYLLGTLAGMPVGLLGVTAGGLLALALARWTAGPAAHDALGRRTAGLAAWLERRPFRSLLIARLLPGMPYNAVSYAAGLTRVRPLTAGAASLIGFAPRAFVYTALGGSLHALNSPEARWAIGATVALTVAALFTPKPGRDS